MFNDMESNLHSLFLAAVAIVAVLNPFGNLPQFISMTEGVKTPFRQKLFRNIVFTAFCIVSIFLLTGSFIMSYLFRVSIHELRVAGGLILMVMSLRNLLFSSAHQDYSHYKTLHFNELFKQTIIPMAFPMLVGPGTLATIIVISEDKNIFLAIGAIIIAFLFIFTLFHYAATIERILGKLALYVFSRIALVFIIAMGFKMIIAGLKGMGLVSS
ncbi:MarC family protein [Helicobacter sp. MIT 14-3879]|uniref:MarC family protein n=1 Tax=Helicobacter sp. MIT 14-3879 TaxID=2040649 RepID=UPI000E1E4E55|nr:MarC family protein [Helicobacter sp. MIT 14-3879]RDU61565.1 MarC family protein [Helicobacter sp. MIT 14-3879]